MKRDYLFEWTERHSDGEGGSEKIHHKIIKTLTNDEFNLFCKEEQDKHSTINFKVTVLNK